jgi:hypothetical protein
MRIEPVPSLSPTPKLPFELQAPYALSKRFQAYVAFCRRHKFRKFRKFRKCRRLRSACITQTTFPQNVWPGRSGGQVLRGCG